MLRRVNIVECRRSNQCVLARGVRLARIVSEGLSFYGIHRVSHRITRMFRRHIRIGKHDRHRKSNNEETGPYEIKNMTREVFIMAPSYGQHRAVNLKDPFMY